MKAMKRKKTVTILACLRVSVPIPACNLRVSMIVIEKKCKWNRMYQVSADIAL